VGLIRALLYMPVHGRVTSAIHWRIQKVVINAFVLKALLPRPRLDQNSIYRKWSSDSKLPAARLRYYHRTELPGSMALQRTVAVFLLTHWDTALARSPDNPANQGNT